MDLISDYSNVDEYGEDFYSNYEYKETFWDIWDNCVVLSFLSILPLISKLILSNLCLGCLLCFRFIPGYFLHIASALAGLFLLNTLESQNAKNIVLGCFILAFIFLYLNYFFRKFNLNCSNVLKVLIAVLLVLCEYYFIEPQIWLQIRGIVMILVMKVISLCDDMDNNETRPPFLHYFSYLFSGTNILMGPWICFEDYLSFINNPKKKNIYWIVSLAKIVFISLIFLTFSNCWSNYLIPEDSNRWLIAYKEAFSFRTSHYFISYLAESGMIAAGFTNTAHFRYPITDPFQIELPSSLAIVVKKWNQPMHEFLKKYVYRSWLKYGKFSAIIATFFMSSLFHGFEVKISVILISLGTFSYLQVATRDKMADTFNICIRVRPCKVCTHKYQRRAILSQAVMGIYSFSTIFHLTYLGILMDPSTDEVGMYEKWQNLYFISHIVMVINCLTFL